MTDYSSRGFLWYKRETLAHDEKRDSGEWTQKDAQNKKETVAFWKIKCIIPHVLPTKHMTPSHFSSTILLLSFLSPSFFFHISFYAPTSGRRPKSKRDPSVFAKKPCWLINKEGGWIRKLNHVGLLMSLPTDKHEILWVFGRFAPSLRLCHHLIIWWDVIACVCVWKNGAETYLIFWSKQKYIFYTEI